MWYVHTPQQREERETNNGPLQVFERHIALGPKSAWRIVGKIIPTFKDLSKGSSD